MGPPRIAVAWKPDAVKAETPPFDYGLLPPLARFRDIFDDALYAPVPDAWWIASSDVTMSTAAIEEGRYRAVNLAGAAAIASIRNALPGREVPFVFGGDGASVLIPPDARAMVEAALAAVLSAAASHAAPRAVPLHDALGLVLAEDVRAPDPLPPFRASIKVSSHGLPFLPSHPPPSSSLRPPFRRHRTTDENRRPPSPFRMDTPSLPPTGQGSTRWSQSRGRATTPSAWSSPPARSPTSPPEVRPRLRLVPLRVLAG